MIRVAVTGAAGRMGSEVVKAVSAEPDLEVVAAIDPLHAGEMVEGIEISGDLAEALARTKPEVLVEFTHPSVVENNVRTALAAGVHCVVGTTGLPVHVLETLAAGAPETTCLFVAPNFAIGAVLMMQFAAEAARFMPHVEIIELHHDRKADAPSGTALRTAALIAERRERVPDTPGVETEILAGARGALADDVTIHSVRLPGLVAHQEVLFGGQGQTLSIRHDSIDRTSFMPGVVLAVREVGKHSGLVVGLEHLMVE
ncbi:MAG: 4-hydroxy-tetrahydrodipicolinate reductase [Coriobacteriia bacterium]